MKNLKARRRKRVGLLEKFLSKWNYYIEGTTSYRILGDQKKLNDMKRRMEEGEWSYLKTLMKEWIKSERKQYTASCRSHREKPAHDALYKHNRKRIHNLLKREEYETVWLPVAEMHYEIETKANLEQSPSATIGIEVERTSYGSVKVITNAGCLSYRKDYYSVTQIGFTNMLRYERIVENLCSNLWIPTAGYAVVLPGRALGNEKRRKLEIVDLVRECFVASLGVEPFGGDDGGYKDYDKERKKMEEMVPSLNVENLKKLLTELQPHICPSTYSEKKIRPENIKKISAWNNKIPSAPIFNLACTCTEELRNMYKEAISNVEAASGGTGVKGFIIAQEDRQLVEEIFDLKKMKALGSIQVENETYNYVQETELLIGTLNGNALRIFKECIGLDRKFLRRLEPVSLIVQGLNAKLTASDIVDVVKVTLDEKDRKIEQKYEDNGRSIIPKTACEILSAYGYDLRSCAVRTSIGALRKVRPDLIKMEEGKLIDLDWKCKSKKAPEYEREHMTKLVEDKLEAYSYLLNITGQVDRTIYTRDNVILYPTERMTEFRKRGMVVNRIPVVMLIALVIGISLMLGYVIRRAGEEEVMAEDLLQAAFSLVALYASTIIPIVYLAFYRGEDLNDIATCRWVIDESFEFEKKTDEELCVIAMKAERESLEPRNFINRKNCCFIEDATRDGQCVVRTPIMLASVRTTECALVKLARTDRYFVWWFDGTLAKATSKKIRTKCSEGGYLMYHATRSDIDLSKSEFLNLILEDDEGVLVGDDEEES